MFPEYLSACPHLKALLDARKMYSNGKKDDLVGCCRLSSPEHVFKVPVVSVLDFTDVAPRLFT